MEPSLEIRMDILNSFIKCLSPRVPLEICYPNAYWNPPHGNGLTYVFHHGHFCEDIYTLVSDIYHEAFQGVVRKLNAIEAINAGWVEFVWYHLGQAGSGVGANGFIEGLYKQIQGHKFKSLKEGIFRLYQKKFSPLVHQMLTEQAKKHWWLSNRVANWAANKIDNRAPGWLMGAITKAIESHIKEGTPGASALRGKSLDKELVDHCHRYLELTLNTRNDFVDKKKVSMVFGHTHTYGVYTEKRPYLFNDGGWIREGGDNSRWPDAYVFHIDNSGNLRALQFGPNGTKLKEFMYQA
jgi:hypothetical protein